MKLYLLIYIKRYKLTSDNKSPLYLRISINGKRAEIALSRNVNPENWDSKRQCVKGRSPEANTINETIRVSKTRIYDLYNKFLGNGEFISAEKLKNASLGINQGRKTICQAFEYHNTKMQAQIGKDFALGTYKRYETCQKLLIEFISFYYKKSDVLLNEINLSFITEFDYYLRTKRNCCNNTTVKYIKNLKKIINQARALEWISHDPFISYKSKIETVDREILTQQELDALLDKKFPTKRLEELRDIFLFCCYTGLAYADVKKLSKDNIYMGIDRNHWLKVFRTKTNVPSNVPLLPIPKSIIEKYKDHPIAVRSNCLLPVPSNQKYNAYLKEIADCTGIHKNLTSHIARHTFATTVTLNNNIPIETVSKMLGHRSIKTTQQYGKVLERKISDDMSRLMQAYTVSEVNNIKVMQK